jgi:hypothetical protein
MMSPPNATVGGPSRLFFRWIPRQRPRGMTALGIREEQKERVAKGEATRSRCEQEEGEEMGKGRNCNKLQTYRSSLLTRPPSVD